ncbi:MAG TPA: BMA_0021/BMA_0022 family TOMM bacteriocin [Candidatus Nanopelagicales bacterium]|nr:BMA_0021/BMA_0022 family TOMM bacteriocin [Candidatus Nanopelagicales bacterium]
MGMEKLMEFRTTYLRAIAQAWSDEAFQRALIEDPASALLAYFNFKWPWANICRLEIATTDRFRWIDDDWVWSKDLLEGLTLYLPLRPPRGVSQPSVQAMALADFYRQHPSLFSDDWGTEYGPEGPLEPGSLQGGGPSHGLITPEIGPGSAPPVGGFAPSDAGFAAFNVALLAAMAKAWDDEHYREMLKIDSAVALQAIRGYEVPWEMTIRIEEDTQAEWHPPGDDPDKTPSEQQSYWSSEQLSTLKLYLPTRPSEPHSDPIALAMYNATGAAYPFTCTC